MRPGLHADDVFIIVEDEFLEVARSFTAPLHHAEYQRLKSSAASWVPGLPVVRPTVETERMSGEAKKGKERENAARRRDGALARLRRGKGGDGDVEALDGEAEIDARLDTEEPWHGTHLAPLMSMAARTQKPTPLVGLQGVPSRTRAAAGYGKAGVQAPRANTYDLGGGTDLGGSETETGENTDAQVDHSDDDLDCLARRPSAPAPASKKVSWAADTTPAESHHAGSSMGSFRGVSTLRSSSPHKHTSKSTSDASTRQARAPAPKTIPKSRLQSTMPSHDYDIMAHLSRPSPLLSGRRAGRPQEGATSRRRNIKDEEDEDGRGRDLREIPIFAV